MASQDAAPALGVGIIGCGNISTSYLKLAPLFRDIEVRAVADLDWQIAAERGAEFGLPAMDPKALLARDDIAIVVNLTIPAAHTAVTRSILEAGKHAYSEKPFVLDLDEGKAIGALADARGLRVGSAPDTFLGGAHQTARALVDAGGIGRITSGACYFMNHGMEGWHPNPEFFYQPGAGPVFDMGPYYITNLLQLLGPVRAVAALTSTAESERTITSQPRAGQTLTVNTPTNALALLHFEQGATISFSASWDVWAHRHEPMELYGTLGSLYLPDPNFFGGVLEKVDTSGKVEQVDISAHPFAQPNWELETNPRANYRMAGLADMAQAIRQNRPHRCSFDMALHAVDVMESILKSGQGGAFVATSTTFERPAPLTPQDARDLLAGVRAESPAA